MKKGIKAILMGTAISLTLTIFGTGTLACPLWECQYDVNDYSCGCQASSCNDNNYLYDEYSQERQPIYCQYCGNEAWECTCGSYSTGSYNTCSREYGSYSTCGSGASMDHWANIRDDCGNIIGQAGAGDNIEVIGQDCSNPDRILIYDYTTGQYGSVLSECVYGGYSWDGSGDNGVFNSYQGDTCTAQQTSYCGDGSQTGYEYGYDYETPYDCGYSSCAAQDGQTTGCSAGPCVYQYSEEMITIIRRCLTILGGEWLC